MTVPQVSATQHLLSINLSNEHPLQRNTSKRHYVLPHGNPTTPGSKLHQHSPQPVLGPAAHVTAHSNNGRQHSPGNGNIILQAQYAQPCGAESNNHTFRQCSCLLTAACCGATTPCLLGTNIEVRKATIISPALPALNTSPDVAYATPKAKHYAAKPNQGTPNNFHARTFNTSDKLCIAQSPECHTASTSKQWLHACCLASGKNSCQGAQVI